LPALPFPFARFFGSDLTDVLADSVASALRRFFVLLDPPAVLLGAAFGGTMSTFMLMGWYVAVYCAGGKL